jgi:hypothetical protein
MMFRIVILMLPELPNTVVVRVRFQLKHFENLGIERCLDYSSGP